jgi:hypothetical protein
MYGENNIKFGLYPVVAAAAAVFLVFGRFTFNS